jgi:23S rRNA (guanosine2251-2'-O)-methyltransferase
MSGLDYIIGYHSVYYALKNSNREMKKIWFCDDGLDQFLKKYPDLKKSINYFEQEKLNANQFQNKFQKIYQENDWKFNRIPGKLVLETSYIGFSNIHEIRESHEKTKTKIIVLDAVTDVNNCAAILRTAAFYSYDFLVLSSKNMKTFNPQFYRIASGASEFVKIINTPSIPRFLNRLSEFEIKKIGLDERGDNPHSTQIDTSFCLVVGNEEMGLSNAAKRSLDLTFKLPGGGEITSLNASVAAGIAMSLFS